MVYGNCVHSVSEVSCGLRWDQTGSTLDYEVNVLSDYIYDSIYFSSLPEDEIRFIHMQIALM